MIPCIRVVCHQGYLSPISSLFQFDQSLIIVSSVVPG